ncbi:unnamed protein product [Mytilus coruscus]|uniref:THAP-type domain-containing protein n=1 Tax=Mytilus coruscus TaxID=42192 RepID=A0A6J8EN41_MYTCO|nr:unnamed protein product [Mytilus coruscus]
MGKPNFCAIRECHNKSRDKGRFDRTVKLHRLPKEGTVRSAWLRAISQNDFKPSTYISVCSDHFPREGHTSIDVIKQNHSYSKTPVRLTLCESGTESENMPLSTTSCTHHDQITQTDTTTAELSIQVTRPEIIIDDIASSDVEVLFYTGLPCYQAFKALFDTVIAAGADRMNVDDEITMQEKSNRKLRLIDEFFMVMMRLRLGLLLNDLQYRFKFIVC